MRIATLFIMILFLIALTIGLTIGCNKDDEIADLESEIKDSDQMNLLEDSLASETEADAASEEIEMTPEATPDEEPAPPANEMPIRIEGDGFVVQIGAGTNYEYVTALVEKFNNRGYDAFTTQIDIEGETFYRIRVGVFEDMALARTAGEELKDRFSVDYWIDNN